MRLIPVLALALCAYGCGGYGSGNNNQPPPATPHIDELSPDNTNAGSADFTLTINGSGFASNSTVYWGSASRTTGHASANQLTAQIPAADVAAAGTVSVSVRTPASGAYGNGMGFVTSNNMTFTVNTP
jgi:hypothetical protein